jgi:hypothetical protein
MGFFFGLYIIDVETFFQTPKFAVILSKAKELLGIVKNYFV